MVEGKEEQEGREDGIYNWQENGKGGPSFPNLLSKSLHSIKCSTILDFACC